MTCIVMMKDRKDIVVGADSRITCNESIVPIKGRTGKFRDLGNGVVIIHAGMGPVNEAIHKIGRPDPIYHITQLQDYMEALWKTFRELDDDREAAYQLLVKTTNNRIFSVYSPLDINEILSYYASGNGMDLALGALYALEGSKMKAENRVKIALRAAAKFNTSVGGPYLIKRYR